MADMRDDGLTTYMAEITRIPLLSPTEEMRLARLALKGDGAARRQLIVANLRLVISIAKKYLYYGLSLQDLIEEGNLGLMKAVERYDPERGCKFSTYATWWIRQSVTRALSNQGRMVRLPVYITDNISRFKKTAEEIYSRTGVNPDLDVIAGEMNIRMSEARRLRDYSDAIVPIEVNTGQEEMSGPSIPEYQEPWTSNKALEQIILDQQMDHLLSQVAEREADIIRFRYGLTDGQVHTLEETGVRFSVTRERIRQIERDVMRRLRAYVRNHREDYTL